MKWSTATAVMPIAISLCCAQAQAPSRPQFEVASIKPSPIVGGGGVITISSTSPHGLALRGIVPKNLILRAYSLKPYQFSGPAWLESEHYDIVAKSSESASDSTQRLMLQDLLASRFGLIAHYETRDLPCYEMVVAESGLKVYSVRPDGTPGRHYNRPNGVLAKQISMSGLADLLSDKLERPVLEKTGVPGVFDFDIEWVPLSADPEAEIGPSPYTALKRLGLKLMPRKVPLRVLIVDHVSKPSSN